MCGSLFGGGSVKTPEIQKVDPAVNNVTSSEINASGSSDAEAARKRKLRQGFAATTLATQAQGKNTLG